MSILLHHFDSCGPGAALAVVVDGRDPRIECRGMADLETGQPITQRTTFDLASVSKVFTATALMLLVERGEVDLAAPVTEYLRNCTPPARGRTITVRDLLWHTSGLADYLEDGAGTAAPAMTPEHVMAQVPLWSMSALAGREHRYSNTNYVLLAAIVEAVSGTGFAAFVAARLTGPFGLHATFVAPTGARGGPATARGYRNVGSGLPLFEPTDGPSPDTVGDGGVRSTLEDLLRWQSLFWSGAIVNDRSLDLMTTPGELDSGERFPYGFGLQIENRESVGHWAGHGGSWTDTTALLGRYLDQRTTVIVLSNEWMAPVERISQRAIAAVWDTVG